MNNYNNKKLLSFALVFERLADTEVEKMPTLEDYSSVGAMKHYLKIACFCLFLQKWLHFNKMIKVVPRLVYFVGPLER